MQFVRKLAINYLIVVVTTLVMLYTFGTIDNYPMSPIDVIFSEGGFIAGFLFIIAASILFLVICIYSLLEKSLVSNWKILVFITILAQLEINLDLVGLDVNFLPGVVIPSNSEPIAVFIYYLIVVGISVVALKLYRKLKIHFTKQG